MKLKATGQKRSVTPHSHEVAISKTEIKNPTDFEKMVVSLQGAASKLGLSGDFHMAFEFDAREFAKLVIKACEQSEALSTLLRAAIANGDLRRAGIKL